MSPVEGAGPLVELALGGADSALAFLGYQIDASVRAAIPSWPIAPQPHVAVLIRVNGIGTQIGGPEALKLVAFVAGIGGRMGEIVQDSVDRGHQMVSMGGGCPAAGVPASPLLFGPPILRNPRERRHLCLFSGEETLDPR